MQANAIKPKLLIAWDLTKTTFNQWIDDKCPRLGAALAYYTMFSLAPMLVIAIAVAGFVFGEEAARGEIVGQLRSLVGETGGRAIESLLRSVNEPSAGILATIVGVVTFLVGATTAFVELQDSLNTVWGVQPKPGRGVMGLLRDRLLSFAMLIAIGFLLMVSLVMSAATSALSGFLGSRVPGLNYLAQTLNIVLSLAIVTALFAMVFKVLPDVKLAWRDVWIGAVATGVLFTIGKYLIGLYLGRSSVASAYGAAGSIAVLLLWIYFSAQLILLGAEFTQVYADRFGTRVVPADNAEWMADFYARLRGGQGDGPEADRRAAREPRIRIKPLPGSHRT
jgi:membrane protein